MKRGCAGYSEGGGSRTHTHTHALPLAFETAAHLLYGHSAWHYLGPDPSVVEKKTIDAIVEAGWVMGMW